MKRATSSSGGACRDLTRRFLEHRQSSTSQRNPLRRERGSGSGALLSEDDSTPSDWAGRRDQLPPAWVDLVDSVEADMATIIEQMEQLKGMHTKRLMVTFDDSSEAAQDRDIELLTQGVTAVFRRAESALKRIASQGNVSGESTGSDKTVRGNITKGLAMRLQSMSGDFRSAQREYLARVKAQKAGGMGGDSFDFLGGKGGSGGGAFSDADAFDSDAAFTDQQQAVLEDTEHMVGQRDVEINKIAQSITELSEIFKELAVLVIDQGTILDRVDFNMEQVVEHTKEGIKQLEKAEEHQKSARPRWCIAILLVLIAVMIGILILKHTDRKKEDNGPAPAPAPVSHRCEEYDDDYARTHFDDDGCEHYNGGPPGNDDNAPGRW